jgi:hypothetical protein
MKKTILAIIMVLFTMSFITAAETAPTKEANLNREVAVNWKSMRSITFNGINPMMLILQVEKLESVDLSESGLLSIKGKKDEKGSQLEVKQVNYFAFNVTTKTSTVTDTKTKEVKVVKDMIVYVAPAGKLF